jgi:hypothetical protein
MQPVGFSDREITSRAVSRRGVIARFGCAAAVALTCIGVCISGVSAEDREFGDIWSGASNGGTATATTGGTVEIGQIITGENTGNSIQTGDITGNAELHGGEIDYPTDVNVTQELGPPIATADGGDGGTSNGPQTKPPEFNVNIDNTDKNRNDNRSNASGVGNGGEGGTGGSGGTVIVGEEPVS